MAKTTKQEILDREYNKHFELAVMLSLQIALQKKLPPEEVSAKKVLKRDSQGNPVSTQDITRGEHIELLEKQLEEQELIIKTIQEL